MATMNSRRTWRARAPRGSYATVRSTRGVKIHYTGGRVDPAVLGDHDLCLRIMRDIQNHHMDGNGWMDFAYSLAACVHGELFMGRGPGRLVAANGAGLNDGHYAIIGLIGSSGLTQPTDELLHALLDGVELLRREGGAGREIKGHRDGYATSCPGEPLYRWVRAGAPRPGTPAPQPTTTSWTETLVKDLPLLREGDDSWDVKTIRWLLGARGYPPTDLAGTEFTPELAAAVEAFQRVQGLADDSVVGPKTWAALLRR